LTTIYIAFMDVKCSFRFLYPLEIFAKSIRIFRRRLASSHAAEVRAVCYCVLFHLPIGLHSTQIRMLHLGLLTHG